MIDLHMWPTPNAHKVTMFLEETGLPYRTVEVNIGAGDAPFVLTPARQACMRSCP